MRGSTTTAASLLPAPPYIRARKPRRKNNVRMAAPQPPKPSSGYAAAVQTPLPAQTPAGAPQPAGAQMPAAAPQPAGAPQPAEASKPPDPNKRQRVYEPFQPPPPAAPRDATDKLGTIAQAVQALQEEQATTTLRYMQMQSQLTDKEATLSDMQAQLHEAKKNLQAATSERDKVLADNSKLRATLQQMIDKEASKKEHTNKLKVLMRQTAECMVALGYATQPVPVVEASAELVFSPGAALSSQGTPISQASQASQAFEASQAPQAGQSA